MPKNSLKRNTRQGLTKECLDEEGTAPAGAPRRNGGTAGEEAAGPLGRRRAAGETRPWPALRGPSPGRRRGGGEGGPEKAVRAHRAGIPLRGRRFPGASDRSGPGFVAVDDGAPCKIDCRPPAAAGNRFCRSPAKGPLNPAISRGRSRRRVTAEGHGGGHGGDHIEGHGGDMQPLCRWGLRRLARPRPPHPPAPRATGSTWRRPAHLFMHTDKLRVHAMGAALEVRAHDVAGDASSALHGGNRRPRPKPSRHACPCPGWVATATGHRRPATTAGRTRRSAAGRRRWCVEGGGAGDLDDARQRRRVRD